MTATRADSCPGASGAMSNMMSCRTERKGGAMTEQLEALLAELISEQDTVTDRNIRRDWAGFGSSDGMALLVEMRAAQARRDAIRDRILAEFEKVRAQRDELAAALQPFAYLAEVMKEGQFLNFKGVYVSWEQAQAAHAAIAKVEGES